MSPTRPSLLVRIRNPEDATSWHAFVETYSPMIYRYGRRRGLQDADAADLTQDTLLEVARCIRNFEYRPERGRFRDWLGLVVRRKLARRFDRRERTPIAAGGASDASQGELDAIADDAAWTEEFNARILQAALELARPHFEPATWRAFEAVWIDEKSAAQAASELALPIDAVYVAKSRVLKRLETEVLQLAADAPAWPLDGQKEGRP